jgi:hypothetical protein
MPSLSPPYFCSAVYRKVRKFRKFRTATSVTSRKSNWQEHFTAPTLFPERITSPLKPVCRYSGFNI